MGKLLDILTSEPEDLSKCSFIITYLIESGFTYEEFVAGSNKGYQKMIPINEGLECVYIHLDFEGEVLSIYKEYECGGELEKYQSAIPECYIDNDSIHQFLEWLDQKCEHFL